MHLLVFLSECKVLVNCLLLGILDFYNLLLTLIPFRICMPNS